MATKAGSSRRQEDLPLFLSKLSVKSAVAAAPAGFRDVKTARGLEEETIHSHTLDRRRASGDREGTGFEDFFPSDSSGRMLLLVAHVALASQQFSIVWLFQQIFH